MFCFYWTHYFMVEPNCLDLRIITAMFQLSEFLGFFTVSKTKWQ